MSKKRVIKPTKKSGFKNWHKITAIIIILAAASFFILTNLPKEETSVSNEYIFKKEGELTFFDSTGTTKKKIDIEIADNEYERQLGLMFRENMTEEQGMLFIFPYQTRQSFWMRNTKLSLDIMFVNEDKKIVTIHQYTNTLSDQSYPSSEPARFVVEVIAGFTEKYNVNVGDRINWMSTRLQ